MQGAVHVLRGRRPPTKTMFVGITPPPASYNERKFVFIWLASLGILVLAFALLFLLIAQMYTF